MYPTHPHVDYAYYMRGLSDFYLNLGVFERMFAVDLSKRDLIQIQKAFVDFKELTLRFPASRYTPSAHQYMIYLRNVLAKHELDVAKYYYNRGAYMAAANRGSVVVTQFQGAPTVKDALVLMVKSYRHLHLTKLESDTLAVLKYNYPEININYNSSYDLS
jgi:outer membrane protein assembly factor BamD